MANDPPARDSSGGKIFRILTWIVLAACVTLATVQFSLRRGRLTLAPGFDDVGYMGDGAERARIYWESGPQALANNLKTYPPHSPFSTMMATAAFLIFGIHDWAPYIMNGILVVAFLWIADHLLRGLKFWQKLIAIFFLLSVPLIVCSVYEFRPDIPCALITITACIIAIERPFLGASFRRLFVIGGLFGLPALLIKPTTLPDTIVMMLGSMFLSTAADYLRTNFITSFGSIRRLLHVARLIAPEPAVKRKLVAKWLITIRAEAVARSWGTVFLVLFLVALPYFAFAGKQVKDYIKENVFGAHAKIWAAKGTRFQHAKFYITGDGGRLMLGDHLWFLLALIAIAGIFCIVRQNRSEIARAIALLLLLLGSFFSVVMNPVESYFFGLPFHMCLVLWGAASAGYILAHSRFFWGTAVVGVAAILGIYNFHWPDNYDNYTSPIATSRAPNRVWHFRHDRRAQTAGPAGGAHHGRRRCELVGHAIYCPPKAAGHQFLLRAGFREKKADRGTVGPM